MLGTGAFLLLATGTAVALLHDDTRGSGTAEARRAYHHAIERGLHYDYPGLVRELRAAWRADPSYLPALIYPGLSAYPAIPTRDLPAFDSLAARHADRALGRCLQKVYAHRFGRMRIADSAGAESSIARLCRLHRLLAQPNIQGDTARIRMAQELFRRYPESVQVFSTLIGEQLYGAGPEVRLAVIQSLRSGRQEPFFRLYLGLEYLRFLHEAGLLPDAVAEERRLEAEVVRANAPGLRLLHDWNIHAGHVGLLRSRTEDSALQRHSRELVDRMEASRTARLLRADPVTRLHFGMDRAEKSLDDGALESSQAELIAVRLLADTVGDPIASAQALVRRGRALVKLGRTRQAERELIAGRDAARAVGHLQWEYEAEHNLLHLYEAQGPDEKALEAGEAFARLTAESGAGPVTMMAHRDLAWFHQRRGQREPARRRFESMLRLIDSLDLDGGAFAGEYFEITGDLDRAEAAFRRDGTGYDIRALGGLVRLAEATGDIERALAYARRHDRLIGIGGYPEATPLLPGLLGRRGRLHEALAAAAAARTDLRRRGQVSAAAQVAADQGEFLLRRGDWRAAVALADSAAQEAARVGSVETRLRSAGIAALARIRLGGEDRRAGQAAMTATLREAEHSLPRMLLVPLLARSAEAAAVVGNPARAFALLERASKLTDSVATSLAADGTRAGYRAMQLHLSTSALELALAAGDAQRFAEWSVRRKSRGVLDRSLPEGGAERTLLPVLRSRLDPGRAVIDYMVLDDVVVALVVTRRKATLHRLPVRPDTLAERVGKLVSRLAPRLGDAVDTLHSRFDRGLALRLTSDLIEPILPTLEQRTRLTIVADGPLHQLPFDLLALPADPGAPSPGGAFPGFLAERFTLDLAPSLAALGSEDEGGLGWGGDLAVVAAPMGSASPADADMEREGRAIVRSFRGAQVTRLTGRTATEAALRRLPGTLWLLHIAAHARANDAEPASARIALVPSEGDDGQLHAYEIDRLRLEGALVVLSACETGAGRLLGGEGVLSLSRAFLRAGARGTVATLWPVGPPAADLMDRFYSRMAAGAPPAAALREAKLELMRGPWPNPLFWAPWVLVTQSR